MSDIYDDFQIHGRVGDNTGFSTDDNGIGQTLAANPLGEFKLQNYRSSFIKNAGRFHCLTDNRWVTDSDDNFGGNIENMNENCGTGANPIYEWEHQGTVLPASTLIRNLHIVARVNNNQVSDIEFSVVIRRPNPITRYETGFDADGEMTNVEILRGFWRDFVELKNGTPFSGNMNDRHGAVIPINHLVTDMGELSIYTRPVGTLTQTRYFYMSYSWEIA